MPYYQNGFNQPNFQQFQNPNQFQQQSYASNQQSYQQSYAPPIPSQHSGLIWVQGEIGARAYPISPGMSTLLMDSEGQNFYIKSADNTGMPTLKKYAYSEVIEEPMRLESHDASNYDTAKLASREEVKKLQEKIHELESQIANMQVNERNNESKGAPNSSIVGGNNNG